MQAALESQHTQAGRDITSRHAWGTHRHAGRALSERWVGHECGFRESRLLDEHRRFNGARHGAVHNLTRCVHAQSRQAHAQPPAGGGGLRAAERSEHAPLVARRRGVILPVADEQQRADATRRLRRAESAREMAAREAS
jgi:hypothetical protein